MACLQKAPPTLATVIQWNLIVQGSIVFLIALLVWTLLTRHGIPPSAKLFAATFAGSLYALSDITMQGHTLDYHCTEGVIPWFVATVWLEYLRLRISPTSLWGRIVRLVLLFVTFAGCLTEWFMFLVVGVMLVRRWWMRKDDQPSAWVDHLGMLIVPSIALAIVIWKVAEVGHFQILWMKFQQRTGLNPKLSGHPGNSLIKDFYHRALGLENSALVWLSLLSLMATELFTRRHLKDSSAARTALLDLLGLGYLLICPCLLHATVLKEHYAIHGDNALKFMVVVAIVPFILMPLLALFWLRARGMEIRLQHPEFNAC